MGSPANTFPRRPKAAFVGTPDNPLFDEIYHPSFVEELAGLADLRREVVTPENFDALRPSLSETEVLLSTWGFPAGIAGDLALLPSLRAVMHAAGSVKGFARPFLERGIAVVNGRDTNAVAVAEFCFAQVILANKGYFANTRDCRDPATARQDTAHTGPGNHNETVALLGYGSIARRLRQLLRPLKLHVLVVDPTIEQGTAKADGIELAGFDAAFRRALVVSNHLPDFPHLRHCIGAAHFESMRHGATFINTGRGRQVDEAALARVFKARPDLTALLDVTDPEPPAPASPFYTLPNVQLTSHIAGVIGNERQRLRDLIRVNLQKMAMNDPLEGMASLEKFDLMA